VRGAWTDTELGTIVSLINGDRGKNYPSKQHRVSEGIPFINAGHLEGGRVRLESMDYISQERFELLRAGCVQADDILLCIRGTLGRVAIATPDVTPAAIASSLVIVRPSNRVDPRFLLAFLRSADAQGQILANDTGAAQPNVGARAVSRITVPLPPLDRQRKIAAVLSAYDDLIENGRRRIKVLDEMAQRIYREWFVDLRYPGSRDVHLLESELGPIPEGWRVCRLADVCTLMRSGGTPNRAKPEYWDEGTVDWYKTSELRDGWLFGSAEKVTQLAVAEGKTRLYPAGTVLMAIYGSPTVGRFGLLATPATCNQAALAMQADGTVLPHALLPFLLKESRAHFNSIAQGAAQQNISKQKVAETKVVIPDLRVAQAAADHIEPLVQTMRSLARAARALQSARDLLMPRLISGQIDVDDFGSDIDEVAA
jgi:type I restriction enzyme S subunit